MQEAEITQLFGDGFYKYLELLLQTVHLLLSLPTVQFPLATWPIVN